MGRGGVKRQGEGRGEWSGHRGPQNKGEYRLCSMTTPRAQPLGGRIVGPGGVWWATVHWALGRPIPLFWEGRGREMGGKGGEE